ncbi:hypothetical protein Cgig2_033427 [Carnegiea gigantea]|uniref:SKP1-like protein 21 n=1 Tax=Carnegiea gigantea TaxID=171969 RepID=A0A9Q1KVB7_9CARY|nr:hypothetical protein Cgig2_033427 [Carnegiea gigantea]
MSELDVVESKLSLPAPIYGQMMKSYIWLQTADGSIQQVEQEVAMLCPVIYHEIHAGKGASKNHPICLPQRVYPAILSLILDYCRFHQVPGHSNKERKSFDERFIRMDTKRLCELASAADSLQLKPLVELTSRALARMIEGKTPEEIREIFCLPDDLTEIAETEDMHVDDRSVDDLLSFINGVDGDSKAPKTSKSKKKHRRRKDQSKNSSLTNGVHDHKKSKDNHSEVSDVRRNGSMRTELLDLEGIFAGEGSLDSDEDDIDPAIKEQIDREVADFKRRLNLNWSERIRELLYGSRTEVSNCIH